MALYFLSDVHLRLDFPDRAERLARMVSRLGSEDRLVVVGDLVDFWFASRQRDRTSPPCPGLAAISRFRDRGGDLALLPGNHDGQLHLDYARRLGIGFAGPHLDLDVYGRRVHAIHGHRVGVRSALKSAMESRAFLHAFGMTPESLARHLDRRLNASNERLRDRIDGGHLERYRAYARDQRDRADLFVFGHVHRVIEDSAPCPLIVLGGWHHQSSYLRIDESGHSLIVEADS